MPELVLEPETFDSACRCGQLLLCVLCPLQGLNDRAVEGRFRWVDCSRPTIWQNSQWAPSQPNDLSGDQDCAQLVESAGWNDWKCERTMQYVCEIIDKSEHIGAEVVPEKIHLNVAN